MSDAAEVQKSIRKYFMIGGALLVFTVITVAASYLNLAVPAAIAVALIIAAMKGSMVASVFMHLSHEKQWIYGALILTVFFFIVLLFIPLSTISDTIGKPMHWAVAQHAGH
jgi:cytochrome c oxidase subunit 4